MYAEMAQYYDRIYSFKDYAAEAATLKEFIARHGKPSGRRWLDVACGTGCHLKELADAFDAEGLDLSAELLAQARVRNPEMTFHLGDMRTFELASRFDVITCLFSSIGYMTTLEDLHTAIANMARHLTSRGVLIVEPWLTPEAWQSGTVHAMLIDDPDLKIARVNTSLTRGNLSVFDLHHLIGTPERTVHFVEHHEMGLYTRGEMDGAFERAGLETAYDEEGLSGRGLHIGVNPNDVS